MFFISPIVLILCLMTKNCWFNNLYNLRLLPHKLNQIKQISILLKEKELDQASKKSNEMQSYYILHIIPETFDHQTWSNLVAHLQLPPFSFKDRQDRPESARGSYTPSKKTRSNIIKPLPTPRLPILRTSLLRFRPKERVNERARLNVG